MKLTARATVRTLITTLVALVVFLLVGTMATPAFAAPSGDITLEIHKFEQPDVLGQTANGLPLDTTGLVPVAGANFTAKRVPGIDVTTNAGQREAAQLSAADAAALVHDIAATGTATTDGAGNATIAPLEPGLYLVQETVVPDGYVGAAPFLVVLPLTDPADRDEWLTTVHVYPKNAKAGIALDVLDQNAVVLGDTVTWTSRSTIPNRATLDGYRIEQRFGSSVELIGPVGNVTGDVLVAFDCADCPALLPSEDFTVDYDLATRALTVDFTPAGLRKLEAAVSANPSARVTVASPTVVIADGIHHTEAVLYPSRDAIDSSRGLSDTATTKWGPLSVLVHERGNPAGVVEGARFMLYASEADALAGRNPIVVDGVREWTTDSAGRFVVEGLRFSGFVNDLDRVSTDPLYRLYWAVPTFLPAGWEWVDQQPLPGAVADALEFQTLDFLVVRDTPAPTPTPDRPVPGLPVTGGQLAGIGLLGGILVAAGLTVVARRRRHATANAHANTGANAGEGS